MDMVIIFLLVVSIISSFYLICRLEWVAQDVEEIRNDILKFRSSLLEVGDSILKGVPGVEQSLAEKVEEKYRG